ncbi:MAG: PHP domain-containing protein [Chloroflexi bacterium]|nr:PHP domain-containing protein [Chloroflexota bacterium]
MPIDALSEATLTGRADLHMHTNVSDGIATVQQMLDHAEHRTDLDVVAITDHDCLDASLWAYEHRHRYRFDIIPGLEVTSRDGHILALWVTRPIPRGMSLVETVAAIHEQGGLAIMAHPLEPTIDFRAFWRYLLKPAVLIESGINAIEIFNAGAITPGGNWLAAQHFRDAGIPLVGNSDAHRPEDIGSGYTRFRGKTAADLRASLVNGWTAAEGESWPITTYFILLHTAIQWKRNKYSRARLQSTPPTLL